MYFVDVIYDPSMAAKASEKKASEVVVKRTTMEATHIQPVAKKAKILKESSNKQQEHAATPHVTP